MKKTALAAAIAATVSIGAEAITYTISASISDSQVLIFSDPEWENNLVFGGTVNIDTHGGAGDAWSVAADQSGAAATLTGSQKVNANVPWDTLEYDLVGAASSDGILFNSGIVGAYYSQDGGNILHDTIDASVDNLHFDSNGTYQTLPIGGIDMSGGTINGDGTISIAFNGLWTGPQLLSFWDTPAAVAQATSAMEIDSRLVLLNFDGELTLTAVSEVPIPAAAWLFGSALLGLVGLKRKK